MSPKMSSLAFDEIAEEGPILSNELAFTPDLQIIKPRNLRHTSSVNASSNEEITPITGRFTVSF